MKQILLSVTLSALLGLPAWATDAVKLPQEFSATIKPGKIHEECIEFKKGQVVAYKFNASQPMPFNIHYHVGKGKDEKVEYPVKLDKSDARSSTLTIPVDQHYCWMWSNKNAEPVSVTGVIALN